MQLENLNWITKNKSSSTSSSLIGKPGAKNEIIVYSVFVSIDDVAVANHILEDASGGNTIVQPIYLSKSGSVQIWGQWRFGADNAVFWDVSTANPATILVGYQVSHFHV